MLGTEVSIKVFSSANPKIKSVLSKAFEEIKRIENMCSVFNKNSELSFLNSRAVSRPVKVSDELFFLIEKGIRMSEISNGAFDITATSIGMKNGYKQIVLNEEKKEIYFNDKNCRIDLGAYAKGYAVDRAIEVLKINSVKNAVVDAGGDVRLIGHPVPDEQWRVGIRNPLKPGDIFEVIRLDKEAAVVTSGNYLREHIVSLQKKDDTVLSVTVIAKTAIEADLFATALFNAVSGDERLRMIKGFDNIEMLVVKRDEDGNLNLIREVVQEKRCGREIKH